MTHSLPDKEAAALRARADALLEIGRYADAVSLLQSGLSQDLTSSPLLCRLAFAFLKMKDLEQALRYASGAVCANPTEEWGHRLRSVILLDKGLSLEAVEAATEAVKCNPDSEQSLHALVKALLGAKQKERAAEVADHLLAIAPDSIWTHNACGLAAMHLHQWEKVVSHCRSSIALDPEAYSAWNNVGMAQCCLGRYSEAVISFREAAWLMPTNRLVHYRIGVAKGLAPLGNMLSAVGLKLTIDGNKLKSLRLRQKQSPGDQKDL